MFKFRPLVAGRIALAASALVGAAFVLTGPAPTAEAAVPPGHHVVIGVQGLDFGKPCNNPSSYFKATSTGVYSDSVLQALNNKVGTANLTTYAVPYSVCSTYDWGKGRWLSGREILDEQATVVSNKIKLALTEHPNANVDIMAHSMGTTISRRCIINAWKNPLPNRWENCRKVDDWMAIAPPSHGSHMAQAPPTDGGTTNVEWTSSTPPAAPTSSSCASWASSNNPCVNQSDGAHATNFSMAGMCGLILNAAQEVCQQFTPGSETIKSQSDGIYGFTPTETTPLKITDETPGATNYVVAYSYEDEVVFFRSTKEIGTPHPSPLSGAANYRVPGQTHGSFLAKSSAAYDQSTNRGNGRLVVRQNASLFAIEPVTLARVCGAVISARMAEVMADEYTPPAGNHTLAGC